MFNGELLAAALSGEPQSRFGSVFWKHFPTDAQLGDAALAAHAEWVEETHPLIVKAMNEQLYPHGDEFARASDWATVTPYEPDHPALQAQVDLVTRLIAEFGEDLPVFATVHGVTASAFHARGGPNDYEERRHQLTDALRADPVTVGSAFDVIGASLLAQTTAMLDAGVDGIYLAALGGESSNFTREEFERHIRPHDLAILEATRAVGRLSFLHICKEDIDLARYAGYPVDIVQVALHLNPITEAQMREAFPGAVVVGGIDNFDPYFLGAGDPADAESLATGAISSMTRSRTIIGADCSLPDTTPADVVGRLASAISTLSS
ncbi:hypothetical protein BW730_07590 [Tessaracoccus aquimaris]|uniref:Uroporphyrinogen decarboxylase (URO-D) domain-containing protein n=1 Tax=Tessaracoccus aquimaris TaxID=1332264 RepID=A0A1Q2CMU5_9ACTN|nr:uroporphyrinogen decarboxylase family protein [Tessaracoccus aquimaris]AQP47385.1 hypothetical protein BW730_07590 [Tessaracoccus aquimaris]